MARVTHKWVGEPHASESVKLVDGVPVARNRLINPSFEYGADFRVGSGIASLTRSGFSEAEGEYGLSVTTSDSSSFGGWFETEDTAAISPSDAGRWIAISTAARLSLGVTHIRQRIILRNESGDTLAEPVSDMWELSSAPLRDQPREVFAAQIPDGTRSAALWMRLHGSMDQAPPQDGVVHTDAWMIVVADTEAEALAQVKTYFDGDTASYDTSRFKTYTNGLWVPTQAKQFDGNSWVPAEARRAVPVSVTHEWAGEPHASESIKKVNGVEVARNYITNPSFETGTHGWRGDGGGGSLTLSDGWNRMWGIEDNQILQATYNGSGSYFGVRHDLIPIEPGQWIAFRSLVADDRNHESYLYFYYRNAENNRTVAQQQGSRSPAPWYPGDEFMWVRQVSNNDEIVFVEPTIATRALSGESLSSGDRLWADRIHVAIADTETEALAQVAEYFDGDTEDYDTVSFSDP